MMAMLLLNKDTASSAVGQLFEPAVAACARVLRAVHLFLFGVAASVVALRPRPSVALARAQAQEDAE